MTTEKDTRKIFGTKGEDEAIVYLEEKGYKIIEQNYRCGRLGEIDIVAKDGDVLVFCEVKSRHSEEYGRPEEAVTIPKRKQIVRMALRYLVTKGLLGKIDTRFDVLAIRYENREKKIEHFVDAFRA
ncbi:MAG: YraN family protein [Candidatus Edwardsbacteria bacterium]